MSPLPKRAILFSRRPASDIARAISCLNERGYSVPLLVCNSGSNNDVPVNANSGLGNLVGLILDNIDEPSAILCVTDTRTLEKIYMALDPDLAIVWSFSFAITEKMLNCRAPVVNYHPAPLFITRGGVPYPRIVLDKSIEMTTATWHYMAAKIDCGPIIMTVDVKFLEGKDGDTITCRDMLDMSKNASLHNCLDLV